jgi:ankyrin repeat protein
MTQKHVEISLNGRPRWVAPVRAIILLAVIALTISVFARIKRDQLAADSGERPPVVWRHGTTDVLLQAAIAADDGAEVRRILPTVPKKAFLPTVVESLAQDGCVNSLNAFLDAGWNPNGHLNDGTPLLKAVSIGRHNTAAALISHGANPNVRPPSYSPALFYAYALNPPQPETVKLLLRHGARIDPDGAIRALPTACDTDNCELLKILLKSGMPPNLPEPGLPPLLFAAMGGDPSHAIPMLVDAGADVNAMFTLHGSIRPHPNLQTRRETLIHMMARIGQVDLVRVLLQNGANPLIKASDGTTAIDVATKEVKPVFGSVRPPKLSGG